jgi:hypothetical protein
MQTIPAAITFLVECWRIRTQIYRSAAIPNGGPDNCGTCGFNRRNRGMWRNPAPDETQTSFCEIRSLAMLADHWTYCQNWHTRTREPIGPIYSSGAYEGGYRRIPWHGLIAPEFVQMARAANVGHPLMMASPFPPWRARPSPSAATCTTCNGGSGNIQTKKRP